MQTGFIPQSKKIGARVQKLAADGKVTTLATVVEGQAATTQYSSDSSTDNTSTQSAGFAKPLTLYAFLGAGAGMFALIIIAWQLHRKGKVMAARGTR